MVGLAPEDVNPSLHLLSAFVGIVVGDCGFVLAGLIKRSSPASRTANRCLGRDTASRRFVNALR